MKPITRYRDPHQRFNSLANRLAPALRLLFLQTLQLHRKTLPTDPSPFRKSLRFRIPLTEGFPLYFSFGYTHIYEQYRIEGLGTSLIERSIYNGYSSWLPDGPVWPTELILPYYLPPIFTTGDPLLEELSCSRLDPMCTSGAVWTLTDVNDVHLIRERDRDLWA